MSSKGLNEPKHTKAEPKFFVFIRTCSHESQTSVSTPLLATIIYVIVFNPPYCFKLSYYDIYYYTKVPILSNSIAKLERNLITKLVPFHRVPSVPTCTHSFLIHKVPSVLVILTRDLQNDTFNGD